MRSVILISDAPRPCGVEDFARGLVAALDRVEPNRHVSMALGGRRGEPEALAAKLVEADCLLVNLPLVAWRRRKVGLGGAMRTARRSGKRVVLILHEWADFGWKRRLIYLPYLFYATDLLFSSPHVRSGFERDLRTRLAPRTRGLIPIPPNHMPPTVLPEPTVAADLDSLRQRVDLLLGVFGSIYAKKQPTAALDIVAGLKRRGHRVALVFFGDYIRGGSRMDPALQMKAAIAERGLAGDVLVTGYLASAGDLFAALGRADAFVYWFGEGLTARRGSVLACLQSGRPVVANRPADLAEFAYHPTYRAALESGQLQLAPHAATAEEMADVVLAATSSKRQWPVVDFAKSWQDVVEVVLATIRR